MREFSGLAKRVMKGGKMSKMQLPKNGDCEIQGQILYSSHFFGGKNWELGADVRVANAVPKEYHFTKHSAPNKSSQLIGNREL